MSNPHIITEDQSENNFHSPSFRSIVRTYAGIFGCHAPERIREQPLELEVVYQADETCFDVGAFISFIDATVINYLASHKPHLLEKIVFDLAKKIIISPYADYICTLTVLKPKALKNATASFASLQLRM